jgi:transcriptional regulator with XRE-family HTH domain
MGLGENIKFLREMRGLTYEAVALAVGTDPQNIFNLEKRKSKVSRYAPALAEFFDIAVINDLSLSGCRFMQWRRPLPALRLGTRP